MHLNFKKYGDVGPHLIIVHGLFGMLDNWHGLALKFAEQMQCWTIDLRNHGKSPHSPDMSYAVMADDLAEFCKNHHLEKAHFLGHSMGGKVVMELAGRYPALVDHLVVADIGPKAYPPTHNEIIAALESVDLSTLKRRSEAEIILSEHQLGWSVTQFLLKNLGRNNDNTGYCWKFGLEEIKANYSHISGAIDGDIYFSGRTLFLRGERSDYIQPEDESDILKMFPIAEFETVADAGHWLHADQPQGFYASVIDFLGFADILTPPTITQK